MKYSIDFSGMVQEWGNVELDATDAEEAEMFAREHIMDAYPEYVDVLIQRIKEIN